MKTGISVFLAGFVLAAGVAAVAPRAVAAEGKAEGKLTVAGKSTAPPKERLKASSLWPASRRS